MANLPRGPHGAEAPPHTARPSTTAADPVPVFNQPDEAAVPIQGGDSLGGIVVNIVISFFMLIMLWMPAACLYPLTSAADVAANPKRPTIEIRSGNVPKKLTANAKVRSSKCRKDKRAELGISASCRIRRIMFSDSARISEELGRFGARVLRTLSAARSRLVGIF